MSTHANCLICKEEYTVTSIMWLHVEIPKQTGICVSCSGPMAKALLRSYFATATAEHTTRIIGLARVFERFSDSPPQSESETA